MSTNDLYFCLSILTIQEFGLPETLILKVFVFSVMLFYEPFISTSLYIEFSSFPDGLEVYFV